MEKTKESPASGSGKKLVQARLSFATFSSSAKKTEKLHEINERKRKTTSDDVVKPPPLKIARKDINNEKLVLGKQSIYISDESESEDKSEKVATGTSDNESIIVSNSDKTSKDITSPLSSNKNDGNAKSSVEPAPVIIVEDPPKPMDRVPDSSKKNSKNPVKTPDRKFTIKFPVSLTKRKNEKAATKIDSPKRSKVGEEKTKSKIDSPAIVLIDLEDESIDKTPAKQISTEEETKEKESIINKSLDSNSKIDGDINKIGDEYDTTLNLKFSDSETEMGDESKSRGMKKLPPKSSPLKGNGNSKILLKSADTKVDTDIVPESTKANTTNIMKTPKTDSPSISKTKSTRSTPRNLKKTKENDSIVFEVSDNAMDISGSFKADETAPVIQDDDLIIVSVLEPTVTDKFKEIEKTPKLSPGSKRLQQQKLFSAEKKRNEQLQKQKEREEKEKQRQREKEEKEERKRKEKEEKEEQRRKEKEEKEEQRKKEKEEKEEQRKKEKEEKERKRLAEIEAKNEEKRAKEEEKRKRDELKEEEKRKKDEERRKKELEKEEAENKKKKAAEAFTKFFVPRKESMKKIDDDDVIIIDEQKLQQKFMPFCVKEDMKLAPLFRRKFKSEDKDILDKYLNNDENTEICQKLYIDELKSKTLCPRSSKRTLCNMEDEDFAVQIIHNDLDEVGETIEDNKPIQKFRAKFFWFRENRRPPYYGTWRKKSTIIKPRRPLAVDKKYFDYEVDSDDEWEEEELGESLHGSDDEKESEDEYEVDNEFFVPHGHLSDEELQKEDELDDVDDTPPEVQKEKLKLLENQFNETIKKKTEKLQPRLIGIVWQDKNGNKPESCSDKIWASLMARSMIINGPIILTPPPVSTEPENNAATPTVKKVQKAPQLDEVAIKNLIRLVHGNRNNKQFLIREFKAFLAKDNPESSQLEYSNNHIKCHIDKIAKWKVYMDEDTKKNKQKFSWVVHPDILKKYNLENIAIKNQWEYIIQPKYSTTQTTNEANDTQVNEDEVLLSAPNATQKELTSDATQKNKSSTMNTTPKNKLATSTITKFTKKLSKVEKEQSFTLTSPTSQNNPAPSRLEQQSSSKDDIPKDSDVTKESEMKKDFEVASTQKTSTETADSVKPKSGPLVKKRVSLLSGPRGQQIPESVKNEFISKFLNTKKAKPLEN